MPGQNDMGGSGDGMYYSWNYGAIHFAAMNSESPIDTAMFKEDELAWANKDLQGVDRSITPWVVAHFHRTFYCAKDDSCKLQLQCFVPCVESTSCRATIS